MTSNGDTMDPCKDPGSVEADVDGDGQPDRVYHLWREPEGAVLGICTASGIRDEVPGAGMTEVLLTSDIEPDERDEIFYGGTTVSAQGASLAVVINGQLQQVIGEDGSAFEVWEGILGTNDGGEFTETATWGCEDIDDDGNRELTSVRVKFTHVAHWTKESYVVEETRARLVKSGSGTESLPDDRLKYPSTLTRSCSDN